LCSQYTTERDNCLQNIFIGNDSLLHILEWHHTITQKSCSTENAQIIQGYS
jgi:hypothetical protein